MVALIPLGGAFRDVITAAGQGLMLCLFYRVLRTVVGDKKWQVIICDVCLLLCAGIFYRSSAAGAYEGGTMRWYTFLSILISYYICFKVTANFFNIYVCALKKVALKPIKLLSNYILAPFLKEINAKIRCLAQKLRSKFKRKVKKRKNTLQKEDKILYNM